MSIDPINIGGAANDGNGQTLRSGGQIINANFAELDTRTTAAQAKAEQGVADAGTAQAAADAAQAKADAAIPGSAAGSSIAQLVNGVVPALQLPSYVDDVLEFSTLANFPATGETGKIYIAINDGDSPSNPTRQYRWSGTAYVMIPSSPGSTDQVPEGTTNLYHTADRVRAAALTGLGSLVNSAILATDSLLQAFAKLQGQINGKLGSSDTAADSSKLGGQSPSYYTTTMVGATSSVDGVKGLVPAPPAGAVVRVLSSLGTWVSQASGAAWGSITGTLANQTDLQAALDAKLAASLADFTIIYPNGGTAGTPATAALNAQYISANPFPGFNVITQVEFLYSGKWYTARPIAAGAVAGGAESAQVDDTIVVRTCITYLIYNAGGYINSGAPGVVTSGALPVRVKVWKVKA